MHDLYNLRDTLVKELEEYGRLGELSKASLDSVNKLSHAAKNVCKVIRYCEENEYGSSVLKSYGNDKDHYNEVKEELREELRRMVESF